MQKAAHRCELVLALVSPEWLASGWCKSEIDAARLMGKKIIVAFVKVDKSLVPLDLSDEQWIDLDRRSAAYVRLKEGFKRSGLDPTSFPLEPGRPPYPGFAYLEEKDAALFFGRDAQIVRGLDRSTVSPAPGSRACSSSWRVGSASRPSCARACGRA